MTQHRPRVIFKGKLNRCPQFKTESTSREVWISKLVKGSVVGLPGVSTGDLDIIIADDFVIPQNVKDVQVCEVMEKIGKFDGAMRIRICLRRLPGHQTNNLPVVDLVIPEENAIPCTVKVQSEGSDIWLYKFVRYSHTLTDPQKAGNIIKWHWSRYYNFLQHSDITDLEMTFHCQVLNLTLSEANRLASRLLYARARELGWSKLTLREQKRFGLSGQWHREDAIVSARYARFAEPNYISDYTNNSSLSL